MKGKNWLAVICLVAGVATAAYGLAHGAWILAFAGIALVLVFWYLVWQWLAGVSKPMGAEGQIKPAANAAWKLKDQPVAETAEKKE
ncbi:MAG: hypothetical protein ACM3PU_13460 [Gemmatimonadota bacterium]